MSSNHIPQGVLTERISDAINGRAVQAAVFLTYQFEPEFFEAEILPILFQRAWSHDPKVRLVQVEEELRRLPSLAVYYDRSGLVAWSQSAVLDYRRIDVSRPTGVFHPKMVLLLVEDMNADSSEKSLIVATMSANLTRAGWWSNVESCHVLELGGYDKSSFRRDLLSLISRVKQEDQPPDEHLALEEIRKFLAYATNDTSHQKKDGRWLPAIYTGQESFDAFMGYFVDEPGLNLEIISPYFDGSGNAGVVESLLGRFEPKEVRIFLPEAQDGKTLCTKEYFAAVDALSRVHWAHLPGDLLSPGSQAKGAAPRFVHAKVYRFWNQNREILFVGSANLTHAAHSSGRSGNFEAAVMVEAEPSGRLTWWLDETVDPALKREFLAPKEEKEDADVHLHNLSLRYDWLRGELSYFFMATKDARPKSIAAWANGVLIFSFKDVKSDRWIVLDDRAAAAVKEMLVSTSIVQLRYDGAEKGSLLIREESMEQKPSLIEGLTPEQILRYWSLLTPEQKELFLATHLVALQSRHEGERTIRFPGEHIESMFDRFAGIFAAFSTFEKHVAKSIESANEQEAACLLLGQKHDSLPSLVGKTIENKEGDPVNRYVTLLCASQLLDRLQKSYPDFFRIHMDEMKSLQALLLKGRDVKDAVQLESDDRSKFLEWFEKLFLYDMTPAAVEGEQ